MGDRSPVCGTLGINPDPAEATDGNFGFGILEISFPAMFEDGS